MITTNVTLITCDNCRSHIVAANKADAQYRALREGWEIEIVKGLEKHYCVECYYHNHTNKF